MLSDHQKENVQACVEELSREGVAFTAGSAGVGKTYSMRWVIENVFPRRNIIGTAPTWAACRRASHLTGVPFISNHGLLYTRPEEDRGGRLLFGRPTTANIPPGSLVLADEAGMLGGKVGGDLESVCDRVGADLWAWGDLFQLGPVNDEPHFSRARVTFELTEVRRQNPGPLLTMLTAMRQRKCHGYFDMQKYADGKEVIAAGRSRPAYIKRFVEAYMNEGQGQILCFKNATRHSINRQVRKIKGFDARPLNIGERLLVLNNVDDCVNGDFVDVVGFRPASSRRFFALQSAFGLDLELYDVTLSDGRTLTTSLLALQRGVTEVFTRLNSIVKRSGPKAKLLKKQLLSLTKVDYGYAGTVHKAQGSQWPWVYYVMETGNPQLNYTAASRPEKGLIVTTT